MGDSTRRVLILEDDRDLANQWAQTLRLRGWEAVVATTRADADQHCVAAPFDVVVTDLFIIGEDGGYSVEGGMSFLLRLRSALIRGAGDWTRTVPIVAVSAARSRVGFDALQLARGSGAARTLRKPFPAAELADVVESFV